MLNINTITKSYGVIYAFSNDTFIKLANKNLKYKSIGYGGYIPKKNYKNFIKDLNQLHSDNIKLVKSKKTDYKIAFDIFMNYELQYSGIESEHIKELSEYGISEANIYKYYDRFITCCANNDLI